MSDDIPFSVLLNSLTPLRGDLLDIDALEEEFNYVCGHLGLNPILDLVEVELKKMKEHHENIREHFNVINTYFDYIRQIYYDGLYKNLWNATEIGQFESVNIEIYSNIMETYSKLI